MCPQNSKPRHAAPTYLIEAVLLFEKNRSALSDQDRRFGDNIVRRFVEGGHLTRLQMINLVRLAKGAEAANVNYDNGSS